jgi:hypothetical protein
MTSDVFVSIQLRNALPEKIRIRQIPKQHNDRISRIVIMMGTDVDFVFIKFPL